MFYVFRGNRPLETNGVSHLTLFEKLVTLAQEFKDFKETFIKGEEKRDEDVKKLNEQVQSNSERIQILENQKAGVAALTSAGSQYVIPLVSALMVPLLGLAFWLGTRSQHPAQSDTIAPRHGAAVERKAE